MSKSNNVLKIEQHHTNLFAMVFYKFVGLGLTEGIACALSNPELTESKPGSIGIPMPNTEMRVRHCFILSSLYTTETKNQPQ